MTLALDFPECSRSPLGRLDPRWKLTALLPAACVAALLQTPAPVLAAAAATAVLVFLAGLPPRWLLLRLGFIGLVLAFFVGWLPFVYPETGRRWDLGWISVSPAGTALAVTLLLKALTLVTLMLALLATAPLHDTFKAAHALRLPGLFVHVVLLSYRFVFLLADEFARLRIALRVRGYRNRARGHSYRTIGRVLGTLLVRSHDRAERVGQAMRCRGFDGCFRSLHEFRTRPADVLWFAAIAGGAAALAAWDFLER
jgi:cobalt/nickel transport system permease protein